MPFSCARAERAAQRSPMARVTGSTFAGSNDSSNSVSSHCFNWSRLLLGGSNSIPRRISARVKMLTYREPCCGLQPVLDSLIGRAFPRELRKDVGIDKEAV